MENGMSETMRIYRAMGNRPWKIPRQQLERWWSLVLYSADAAAFLSDSIIESRQEHIPASHLIARVPATMYIKESEITYLASVLSKPTDFFSPMYKFLEGLVLSSDFKISLHSLDSTCKTGLFGLSKQNRSKMQWDWTNKTTNQIQSDAYCTLWEWKRITFRAGISMTQAHSTTSAPAHSARNKYGSHEHWFLLEDGCLERIGWLRK